MQSISELLSQPDRDWRREPPATETDILGLVAVCPVKLPEEYLDLLRYSHGGEGSVALPPHWFVLDRVDVVIDIQGDEFYRESFRGFWFFGGNGGGEMLAFDLRGDEPWPIVMIDPIAGPECSQKIAQSFAEFLEAIGLEYNEKKAPDDTHSG